MGIYYFAVDYDNKEQIWAPKGFGDKSPSVFHPHNPLPGMVFMKNTQGADFVIINDVSSEHEHGFKDVTNEVYEEYKKKFPNMNWDEYENGD